LFVHSAVKKPEELALVSYRAGAPSNWTVRPKGRGRGEFVCHSSMRNFQDRLLGFRLINEEEARALHERHHVFLYVFWLGRSHFPPGVYFVAFEGPVFDHRAQRRFRPVAFDPTDPDLLAPMEQFWILVTERLGGNIKAPVADDSTTERQFRNSQAGKGGAL